MTQQEADEAQNWHEMDGATAWHLIQRNANDWGEVHQMMHAWLRANANTAAPPNASFSRGPSGLSAGSDS